VRVITILAGAQRAGLVPLPLPQLHSIAYFSDALAPVWDLRILDAHLLKREAGPRSPKLQQDVDRLVGMGVLLPRDVKHLRDPDGKWRLHAAYVLHATFGDRILKRIEAFKRFAEERRYVQEVVYAMSGLGLLNIANAAAEDATYGNELVDVGDVVDVRDDVTGENQTSRVARRFGELLAARTDLSSAEMIHLYVRALNERIQRAA
jgi:hypothetical protein